MPSSNISPRNQLVLWEPAPTLAYISAFAKAWPLGADEALSSASAG